jgi:hypothetical protein
MDDLCCYRCGASDPTASWRVLWPALLDGTQDGEGYVLCPDCLAEFESRNSKNPPVGAATTD